MVSPAVKASARHGGRPGAPTAATQTSGSDPTANPMNHANDHDVTMKQQLDEIARCARDTRIAVLELLELIDGDFRNDIDAMMRDAQHIQHMSKLLRVKAQLKQIEGRHNP